MSIKIISDTACDLPDNIVEKYKIDLVPFRVNFENGESFLERFELTSDTFVEKMESSKVLPKTAAPDPAAFMRALEKGLSEADYVLVFCVSSAMSAAFQNACLARDMLNTDRVTIFDTLSISLGIGIMMIIAARMIEQGISMAAIGEELKSVRHGLEVFMMVDSLDNMIKGGRIGKYGGLAGNLLNIKPIVRVRDQGVPELFEKVRGQNKAIRRMVELVGECAGDRAPNRMIGICHLGCPERAQILAEAIRERYHPQEDILISQIGTTLGTHGGKGSLFLTF